MVAHGEVVPVKRPEMVDAAAADVVASVEALSGTIDTADAVAMRAGMDQPFADVDRCRRLREEAALLGADETVLHPVKERVPKSILIN